MFRSPRYQISVQLERDRPVVVLCAGVGNHRARIHESSRDVVWSGTPHSTDATDVPY